MVLVPSNAPRNTTLRSLGAISLAQASRCDAEPVETLLSGNLRRRCCWFGVSKTEPAWDEVSGRATNTHISNFIGVHMDTVDQFQFRITLTTPSRQCFSNKTTREWQPSLPGSRKGKTLPRGMKGPVRRAGC